MELLMAIAVHISSYFFTPAGRLEKNVGILKHEQWFAQLENDFRYNHLIWNNRKVTRYLGLNSNVDKLLKDEDEKARFKKLLTYEHIKFITTP